MHTSILSAGNNGFNDNFNSNIEFRFGCNPIINTMTIITIIKNMLITIIHFMDKLKMFVCKHFKKIANASETRPVNKKKVISFVEKLNYLNGKLTENS